ncbi:hypothetical protein ACHAXT_009614 [Thalassiosira profunda]
MDDAIDHDDARHRREEAARRAKRQKHRDSKSRGQSEKERKRREHAQRILGAQKGSAAKGGKSKAPSSKSPSSAGAAAAAAGGSSAFQRLFQERAEGFSVRLRFRNAPPRPPVGPTFVGLGLDGELTDKWTKYKARNAVERAYTWKLHVGKEVGVPLAPSAMDWEGCYTDPNKEGNKNDKEGEEGKAKYVVPALAPEDEALINWKGGLGDAAAERLQQRQDRRRSAARLALAQGHGTLSATNAAAPRAPSASGGGGPGSAFRLKKHHLQSRVLDEKTPFMMKKTTYLTNDATSVHQFKSLADEKSQRAKDVDRALEETRAKNREMDVIEKGFQDANPGGVVKAGNREGAAAKATRVHPAKPAVKPVWDVPLLPDAAAWGQTYAHVVLDNPPKTVPQQGKKAEGTEEGGTVGAELFRPQHLGRAIVTDVAKQKDTARMACTVWVPSTTIAGEKASGSGEANAPPAKKSKFGRPYAALQRYDLDVTPLRDPSDPHVQYVWIVDPAGGHAGYHAVGSRVQLSTGRPVVVGRAAGGGEGGEAAANRSYVAHRALGAEERKAMEVRRAAVDVDLAAKHGLVEEDDEDEEKGGGATGEKEKESMEVEA